MDDLYLRAIGFSELDDEDVSMLKDLAVKSFDKRCTLGLGRDKIVLEYHKSLGYGIGIIVRGILNNKEELIGSKLEPYALSDEIIDVAECFVECTDGMPIIIFEHTDTDNEIAFSLQNILDYSKDVKGFQQRCRDCRHIKKINMAAISIWATVLLPIEKKPEQQKVAKEESVYYKTLLTNSRAGDKVATQQLAVYEEESFEIIRNRLEKEDVLSVIDSYFLPYEQSDDFSYDILGEIETLNVVSNDQSGEEVYKMQINAVGIKLQLYINKYDVLGKPSVGMRLMANCKLIGQVQ